MGEWQPIESAPKGGTVFLSLNHDLEVWVTKYTEEGKPRLCYRTNKLHEPRRFEIRKIDGEEWMKEDKAFNEKHETWMSSWTYWSRGYEFRPTHWMPLPVPTARTPLVAEMEGGE